MYGRGHARGEEPERHDAGHCGQRRHGGDGGAEAREVRDGRAGEYGAQNAKLGKMREYPARLEGVTTTSVAR